MELNCICLTCKNNEFCYGVSSKWIKPLESDGFLLSLYGRFEVFEFRLVLQWRDRIQVSFKISSFVFEYESLLGLD